MKKIVMFKTTQCGACKMVSPILEEMLDNKEIDELEIIDITINPDKKPNDMAGAPFFKITCCDCDNEKCCKPETATGFMSKEMIMNKLKTCC